MATSSSSRSLIVPVFNGFDHLPLLWDSIAPHLDGLTEVILVNDGSSRDITECLGNTKNVDSVQIIRHPYPYGFARAVNAGLRVASGDFLFILNSDLILGAKTLSPLTQALHREPSIGMIAGKLLYPQTGRIQHVGIAYSATNHYHVFRHANKNLPLACRPREVQALAFALCCMPREVYEEVGDLDEHYYNSYEDLDYCFRLRRLGFKLQIEPASVAYHWERQSGPIRSVLRKDNVARLWRDWGTEIKEDLVDYIREACLSFKSLYSASSSLDHTLVNISRGREAEEIVAFLSSPELGLSIVSTWEFGYRNRDQYRIWLPQVLPVDAIRHSQPFIYLVDELPQLDENVYWFSLRRQFVTDEIVVDHNANVVSTLEYL